MKNIIQTEQAPAAIGPYSQARRAGDFLFISGQIGLDPETGNMVSDGIEEQTRQSLRNMAAILMAAGLKSQDVVKATIYLTDINNFQLVNEIYGTFFGDHKPSRACVEVSKLPKGSLIEIEAVAYHSS